MAAEPADIVVDGIDVDADRGQNAGVLGPRDVEIAECAGSNKAILAVEPARVARGAGECRASTAAGGE